jgi:hypothetical protein
MKSPNVLNIQLDPKSLRPLVEAVVGEALARLESERVKFISKLAYTEAEAARLLSLRWHQLRDERRRGRIQASHGPGKLILYSPTQLTEYLASRPYTARKQESSQREESKQ